MLTLHTKLAASGRVDGELVLSYDQRERCRQRARLDSGEEVALFTARGTVLREGDLLTGETGFVARVRAAMEPVYVVRAEDAEGLLRCAFHLGNRHCQVEVGDGFLRIRIDPVLRDMLTGLGAVVTEEVAAFEPESGAYAGGHAHSHPLAPVPLRQKIHRPDGA
ncbi:urease accessory protein UreE [Duganella sp. Root1480D1]|uniref:urease accessory protein UreE n=1 Tax=Duganella sp. Root1480D1 TaxID=1736471 RepID=UPI00070AA1E5|nr:urease accessory protein UreE [Duganella sp. Root1480D1]KQZ32742.1 urease accessory protein UreE [Duganella sp. Root1480D1]